MSSPIFKAMGGNMPNMGGANNPFRMVQEFINFANNFHGDPKAEIQKFMQSGKLTQDQLNQAQGLAQQFQGLLSRFPRPK